MIRVFSHVTGFGDVKATFRNIDRAAKYILKSHIHGKPLFGIFHDGAVECRLELIDIENGKRKDEFIGHFRYGYRGSYKLDSKIRSRGE